MKTITKPLLIIVFLCTLCFSSGCESLRFAPTESQKQVTLQSYLNARAIEASGTEPQSPAVRQLVTGTETTLAYTGMPKKLDIDDYETTLIAAQADAVKRPSAEQIFETAEQGLSLAAELAILFGVGGAGFGGKKLLDWLKLAREKNQALQEIIAGNELFMKSAKNNGQGDILSAFKDAQLTTQKSAATKLLVTEIKG